jgi:hypothetical protein
MYAMGRKLLVPLVHALVIDWYDYSVIVVVALRFGLYLLPDFELLGKVLQPRIATDEVARAVQCRVLVFIAFELGGFCYHDYVGGLPCLTAVMITLKSSAQRLWDSIVWHYTHHCFESIFVIVSVSFCACYLYRLYSS